MRCRAQGSVEYLIIIGIVLVVALMVVSVLGFFPATAGESVASQSQLYWRGQAKPFSIIDTDYRNASVCNNSNYGVVLMVKNNEKYTLTLTKAYFENVNYSVCDYGNSTGNVEFMSGQEKLVGVSLPTSTAICANRTSHSVETGLLYNSPYITGKLQLGSTDLFLSCR